MRKGFIGLVLLTSLAIAFADDDGHKQDGQDGHKHGHHIKGAATFVAHVVLTPTESAPKASGRLNLQSVTRNDTVVSKMEIQTFGLAFGDYNISASLKSGDTVSIGTISLVDRSHGHVKGRGLTRTANHFTLPDSINPTDISQIIVADSSGTTDLVGDFVNLAKGSSVVTRAAVKLSGGDAAPNATGAANLSVVAVNDTTSGAVVVAASNLPTNTVLNVTANDQPVATTTTTKSGTTVLRNLRNIDLRNVNDVTLTTTSGTTAATAGF
jgi:hypothetical protein